MGIWEGVALAVGLGALAALPSASVLLVVARSAAAGPRHGLAAAAGIALADLGFVLAATLGLGVVATQLGGAFAVVKYLAAAGLIGFGVALLAGARRGRGAAGRPGPPGPPGPPGSAKAARTARSRGRLAGSFAAGLALTLGDVKALVVYASLLPSVLNPARLTPGEVGAIACITVLAVGGVKAAYALLGARLVDGALGPRGTRLVRAGTGGLMIAAGGTIAFQP